MRAYHALLFINDAKDSVVEVWVGFSMKVNILKFNNCALSVRIHFCYSETAIVTSSILEIYLLNLQKYL